MLASSVLQYIVSRLAPKKLSLTNLVPKESDHKNSIFDRPLPMVSIVIPTRDRLDLLKPCVESILGKTQYDNFELIIIDNGSEKTETLTYLQSLELRGVKVSAQPGKFNFSKLCNIGASFANGQFICFLNNDVEVLEGQWLKALVEHGSRDYVGIVGATLVYPNQTIQHFGLVLGNKGIANHVRQGEKLTQVFDGCHQVSAITFACALVSAKTFELLGGLDENFAVGLNDVDLSVRGQIAGLANIQCSEAVLMHRESQSRKPMKSAQGAMTAAREVLRFLKKHKGLPQDAFYS